MTKKPKTTEKPVEDKVETKAGAPREIDKSDPNKPGNAGDPDLPEDAEMIDPDDHVPPAEPPATPTIDKPGSAGNPDIPEDSGGDGGGEDFALTAPPDGSTQPAVYDISGTGADPSAEVTLWSDDRDPSVDDPNARTLSGPTGAFTFAGENAQTAAVVTWHAESGGKQSSTITITLEAEE